MLQFLTEFFEFVSGSVAIAFCGHLSKVEMDGVAMAVSVSIISYLSLFFLASIAIFFSSIILS